MMKQGEIIVNDVLLMEVLDKYIIIGTIIDKDIEGMRTFDDDMRRRKEWRNVISTDEKTLQFDSLKSKRLVLLLLLFVKKKEILFIC